MLAYLSALDAGVALAVVALVLVALLRRGKRVSVSVGRGALTVEDVGRIDSKIDAGTGSILARLDQLEAGHHDMASTLDELVDLVRGHQPAVAR